MVSSKTSWRGKGVPSGSGGEEAKDYLADSLLFDCLSIRSGEGGSGPGAPQRRSARFSIKKVGPPNGLGKSHPTDGAYKKAGLSTTFGGVAEDVVETKGP